MNSISESGDQRKPDLAGCELTRRRVQMAIIVIDALGPELAEKYCI